MAKQVDDFKIAREVENQYDSARATAMRLARAAWARRLKYGGGERGALLALAEAVGVTGRYRDGLPIWSSDLACESGAGDAAEQIMHNSGVLW